MQGKTLTEFIDGLYYNAEMEIEYNEKRYIISCYLDNNNYIIRIDSIDANSTCLFYISDCKREKCVEQFETAKIFDGRTIYEAHNEITVLYG